MLKQYNQIKNAGVSLDCRGGVSLTGISSIGSGIYLFEMTCNDISIGTERLIIE